jgi:hypothetical protein
MDLLLMDALVLLAYLEMDSRLKLMDSQNLMKAATYSGLSTNDSTAGASSGRKRHVHGWNFHSTNNP